MKMKKMIGAVALTAALAMGTAPAFAATASASDITAFDNTDKGSTEITAKVEKKLSEQVRAEIPLKVVVVLQAEGGGTIAAPSASSYGLTNKGTANIKLANVELEKGATLTAFDFGTVRDESGSYVQQQYGSPITTNTAMLTFAAGPINTYLSPSHSLSSATNTDKMVDSNFTDTKEATLTPTQTLPITLGGLTYFPTKIDSTHLTDTICTLKYTIASAS